MYDRVGLVIRHKLRGIIVVIRSDANSIASGLRAGPALGVSPEDSSPYSRAVAKKSLPSMVDVAKSAPAMISGHILMIKPRETILNWKMAFKMGSRV